MKDRINLAGKPLDEDYQILYPLLMAEIAKKAEEYKQESQKYRQICCIQTFTLSLVMVSRVRDHYVHAPWFRLSTLRKMVNTHGSVSTAVIVLGPCLMRGNSLYLSL